jgi:lipopolysaccharide transport system ATP-binding protein
MSKAEIRSKFDAIVDFAEMDKFIDTPVKRYSSGMYVRLAFAVAAHLEPEILIIDEVLAVGDAAFQKKCIGKMQEVSQRDGRTILLVSHNMPTVLRLCNKAILLSDGAVCAEGRPERIANIYASPSTHSVAERVWNDKEQAPGNNKAKLRAVRILDADGNTCELVQIHKDCFLEIEYWNLGCDEVQLTSAFHVINEDEIVVFASADFNNFEWRDSARIAGLVRARCKIPAHLLAEGRFSILAAVVSYNPDTVHAYEPDVASFQVVDRTEGEGARGLHAGVSWPGVVRPFLTWQVEQVSSSEPRPPAESDTPLEPSLQTTI